MVVNGLDVVLLMPDATVLQSHHKPYLCRLGNNLNILENSINPHRHHQHDSKSEDQWSRLPAGLLHCVTVAKRTRRWGPGKEDRDVAITLGT